MGTYARAGSLGAGGFGAVVKIFNTINGTEAAAKLWEEEDYGETSPETLREIVVLSKFKESHKNLISVLDFSTNLNMSEPQLFAVLPLMRGDLSDWMYHLRQTQRLKVCHGALNGINFMHQNHFMHRDLKPENVLIDTDFCAKLIDFSLSKWFGSWNTGTQLEVATSKSKKSVRPKKVVDKPKSNDSRCGTVCYLCPQMIKSERYTELCDVWSMGVVFLEIFRGKRFECERDKAALKEISTERDLLNEQKPMSNLVISMLSESEDGRVSAAEALNHQVFANFEENCALREVRPFQWRNKKIPADNISRDILKEIKEVTSKLSVRDECVDRLALYYYKTLLPSHAAHCVHLALKVLDSCDLVYLEDIEDMFTDFKSHNQKEYELDLLNKLNYELIPEEF